jgi:hypothetical protein
VKPKYYEELRRKNDLAAIEAFKKEKEILMKYDRLAFKNIIDAIKYLDRYIKMIEDEYEQETKGS